MRGGERLAYGVYSPDVFDVKTGRLSKSAIQINRGLAGAPHVDDCGNSTGASFCRIEKSGAARELQQVLNQLIARKPTRQIEGMALASARSIRAISDTQYNPTLIVLDDGNDSFRSHAVVRGAAGLSRAALKGPRHDLVALLDAGLIRRYDIGWPI